MKTASKPMSSDALLFDAARKLVAASRLDDAEYAYSRLLESLPSNIEALEFVSTRALGRGQVRRAVGVLERAVLHSPDSGEVLRGLGIAYKVSGQLDSALNVLVRASKLDPQDYVSRLLIGETLESLGHSYGALTNYFGALTLAQMNGLWFDEASTPPGQKELVIHATRFVTRGRSELLAHAMAPLIARHGAGAMRRVTEAVDIYLGDAEPRYADDRQRPLFLYFPGLPTQPYFERELFPWIEELESGTADIRDEVRRVLAESSRLEPVHGSLSAEQLAPYLSNSRGGALTWDSYFFYRHGKRYDDNCTACPLSIAAIDRVPLARIRDHGPEAMFSVLTPGTHILPHRGVTNSRLVAHLPLIVPNDCALVVGGEPHVWEEGRVMVFDDTFEHEAWNRSEHTRTILIIDIWNPHLDEAERDALAALVPAIGDFNRDCGV